MRFIKIFTCFVLLFSMTACAKPTSDDGNDENTNTPTPTIEPAPSVLPAEPDVHNAADDVSKQNVETGFENNVVITPKIYPLKASVYQFINEDSEEFVGIYLDDSVQFLKGGTGIIVFSAPSCPFCNRALPVLKKILSKNGVKAYYVDTDEPFGATTPSNANSIFAEFMTLVEPILVKDENGEPSFEIPEVVAVKDGKIIGHHLSLVDDYVITNKTSQMNEKQIKELEDIYQGLIDSVIIPS